VGRPSRSASLVASLSRLIGVSDLPPPPPAQAPPTQVVGQQAAPSTAVPMGGTQQSTSIAIAGRKMNSLAVVSLVTAVVAPFGHVIGVGGITLIIVSLVTATWPAPRSRRRERMARPLR
jgi:hypothetical protein